MIILISGDMNYETMKKIFRKMQDLEKNAVSLRPDGKIWRVNSHSAFGTYISKVGTS